MGCMKLVESSVLDLDLDISEYLPFDVNNPNHPDATITSNAAQPHVQRARQRRLQPVSNGNLPKHEQPAIAR